MDNLVPHPTLASHQSHSHHHCFYSRPSTSPSENHPKDEIRPSPTVVKWPTQNTIPRASQALMTPPWPKQTLVWCRSGTKELKNTSHVTQAPLTWWRVTYMRIFWRVLVISSVVNHRSTVEKGNGGRRESTFTFIDGAWRIHTAPPRWY